MNAKVNSIRMLAISGLSVMMLSQASATVTEEVKLTLLPNKKVMIEDNIPRDQSANLEITNMGTREVMYNDEIQDATKQFIILKRCRREVFSGH